MATYKERKLVIATTYAEPSITMPDITAVYDSGLHNRKEELNGSTGLFVRRTSLKQREQRRGRAGRVGPGVYIERNPLPQEPRDEFPVPEPYRLRPDDYVLKLAS